jgi:hypothetical protein
MPTGKQKNRKYSRSRATGRFQKEQPEPSEAGPSSSNPLPTLPTTPNTSTVPTSPPRAPQPTRTRPQTVTPPSRTATPPQATPHPAIPQPITPRPATWDYREPIQDESPISENLLLRQHSPPHQNPIYSSPIRSQQSSPVRLNLNLESPLKPILFSETFRRYQEEDPLDIPEIPRATETSVIPDNMAALIGSIGYTIE